MEAMLIGINLIMECTINNEGNFLNDNLTLTHLGKYNRTGGNTVSDENSVSYWNGSKSEPNDWGNSEDCIQMSPMWVLRKMV